MKICYGSASYKTTLNLSGCTKLEFTCTNGECIEMNHRCDGVTQCIDGSDEQESFQLELLRF